MIEQEYIQELKKHIYDPNLIQVTSLDKLEKAYNGELNIPDPTNPFMFLLENTSLVTAAAMQGIESNMRNLYPYLATNKEDLYHHLNNGEINDIFATPSNARFQILINKSDFIKYGHDTGSYIEAIIPKYSYITVADTIFTLLNNIFIRYYKSTNKIITTLEYNSLDLAINNDVILESKIITDNNNIDWIMLDLEVPQVTRYYIKDTIFISKPYVTRIKLKDNEYYTYISVKSKNRNNMDINLNITYSNFVFDPNHASLIVQPMDHEVRLEIPSGYLLNKMVNKYIEIELFATQGNIELPLNTYQPGDFKLTIELNNTTDPRVIGAKNIAYVVSSYTYTYGGKTEITFEDLKNKILNHSTGDNKLPITIYEIGDRLKDTGFKFKRVSNTILEREILITKNIGTLEKPVSTAIDIFSTDLELIEANNFSSNIKFQDGNKIIINPFQIFRLEDNKAIPLKDVEVDKLKETIYNDLISYNKNKYFFNLYKYILDYEDRLSVRIYEVNQPKILKSRATYTSNKISTPIVITDRVMRRNINGYEVYLMLEDLGDLQGYDFEKIHGQLSITLKNGNKIYFKSDLAFNGQYYYFSFPIIADDYITKDDEIKLTTNVGVLKRALVNLISDAEFIMYTTEDKDSDEINANLSLVKIDKAKNIFFIENFEMEFGKKIETLFTNYNIDYTDRKFMKYEEDVYLTYKEDIYELDDDGTPKIIKKDTDGDGEDDDFELVIKHKKGDYVLDENGNKILLHKKGDIMLDDNGKPIIDKKFGIIHRVNILLLEELYLRTTDSIYIDYRIEVFTKLTEILDIEINDLNQELLENTKFKFIPDNNIEPVVLDINYRHIPFDNFIVPELTLYIDKEKDFILTDDIEMEIYKFIQEKIQDNFNIAKLEHEIKELLGDFILSVKLRGIVNDENINVINYTEDSSKFIIAKELTRNENKLLIVKPKIKINLIKI